ncbi:hypothetical protein BCT11_07105 [Vibrio sp. 10N.222.52.B12]|uniref:hypothetical protein n=1 Tax=Vibrio sp. 10N.222.52.B12 TaxID=1880840 RepID=UPI000C8587AF|nr:hypothetical protein [Vibrio sp. 10N.222.52.B12]PMO44866.1 hypothetical protein BCT11_07105 [Vibrio sp. 10N.222.52.B12]
MTDDLWIYAGSSKTTDANDKEPVEVNVAAGNMFWADDQSGQDLDIQFAVNGKRSPSLPKEFTPKATLLPNTAEGTCNSLEVYVNGQGYTILENRSIMEGVKSPGDLRAAILTCPAKSLNQKTIIKPNNNGDNEVISILKASSTLVLPENLLGEVFDIDQLSEEVVSALYDTLAENSLLEVYDHLSNSNRDQNATATMMVQMVDHGKAYTYYKEKYGADAARGYLKEFIVKGQFSVKRMSQWGGKLGIVFKGDRRNRAFLTGINYGIDADKVQMFSSIIQASEDMASESWRNLRNNVSNNANPFKGTNIISFVFVASFDVYEFFTKDIGEQNIAEFLGALGITTAKLFISGVISMLVLAFAVMYLGSFGVVLSAGILFLSIAGVSFLVGWGIDALDTKYEVKDKVKLFLKDAFPGLTIENMINKDIDKNKRDIENYIGSSAMHGSGFFGF